MLDVRRKAERGDLRRHYIQYTISTTTAATIQGFRSRPRQMV